MLTRRRAIALCTATAVMPAAFAPAVPAHAQSREWPNRVVRFMVPVSAGGPTDLVARILADQLSKVWHQQVVVENKGGAGTNLGNELVARSDPDGYTVLYATASLAVNRSLYRSLSYDAIADFAPVSLVSRFPLYMFVPNSSPAKSGAEFIAYAKAHPGKMTMASPGTGSGPHLASELFKQMAGIEMAHAPYRGAAQVLNDLIPGRVDCYFASGALLANMRSGQIRALGVTSAKPDPAAPDVPAIADTVPGYEASSWHALFVPAKTPSEIVKKMSADTIAALADPAVKDKLTNAGGYPAMSSSPGELEALLKSDIAKWAAVIKGAGIKID